MGVHNGGGRREMHVGFWQGDVKERNSLEHPVIDEITTLKWVLKGIGWDRMDWINQALIKRKVVN